MISDYTRRPGIRPDFDTMQAALLRDPKIPGVPSLLGSHGFDIARFTGH